MADNKKAGKADGLLTRCDNCGSDKTRVAETRSSETMPSLPTRTIRRMRACESCNNRWPTIELTEEELDRLQAIERALGTMRSAFRGNGNGGK